MKWIIDYIINGGARRTVRISRDHLPGLTPPKPAPFRPTKPQDVPPQKPSINDYYQRFLASDASKPKTYKPKRMDKLTHSPTRPSSSPTTAPSTPTDLQKGASA